MMRYIFDYIPSWGDLIIIIVPQLYKLFEAGSREYLSLSVSFVQVYAIMTVNRVRDKRRRRREAKYEWWNHCNNIEWYRRRFALSPVFILPRALFTAPGVNARKVFWRAIIESRWRAKWSRGCQEVIKVTPYGDLLLMAARGTQMWGENGNIWRCSFQENAASIFRSELCSIIISDWYEMRWKRMQKLMQKFC